MIKFKATHEKQPVCLACGDEYKQTSGNTPMIRSAKSIAQLSRNASAARKWQRATTADARHAALDHKRKKKEKKKTLKYAVLPAEESGTNDAVEARDQLRNLQNLLASTQAAQKQQVRAARAARVVHVCPRRRRRPRTTRTPTRKLGGSARNRATTARAAA